MDNDIPTPKGFYFKNNLNSRDLNFPIVVKPTNLSGGRGIEVVTNQFKLNNALRKAQALSDDVFWKNLLKVD